MLNTLGITIEIGGAGFMLLTARISRKRSFNHVGDNIDRIGPAVDFLLDEVRGNFGNQLWGFSIVTFGLLLQLIASFI